MTNDIGSFGSQQRIRGRLRVLVQFQNRREMKARARNRAQRCHHDHVWSKICFTMYVFVYVL